MTTKLNYSNATNKQDLRNLRSQKGISSYDVVDPVVVTTNVLVTILKDSFGSELFVRYLMEDLEEEYMVTLHEECMRFFIDFGLHNVATKQERTKACSTFLKMRTSNNPRF
tara:strand:- start:2330 stop:2662 length:333 start_codon:yes stop_codon:yes gene_type:complete